MFELEKEERQQRLQKRQERKLREQEEYQRKQRVRCVCIGGIHTPSHETQGTKLERFRHALYGGVFSQFHQPSYKIQGPRRGSSGLQNNSFILVCI